MVLLASTFGEISANNFPELLPICRYGLLPAVVTLYMEPPEPCSCRVEGSNLKTVPSCRDRLTWLHLHIKGLRLRFDKCHCLVQQFSNFKNSSLKVRLPIFKPVTLAGHIKQLTPIRDSIKYCSCKCWVS